ncbi:NUDIX domain-containing protein [Microbacterium sp. CFH 31415]|uniref:NUDIX domain-containing protein n=1 Tax=Microbacterium sp. CFH 31415 TaxID=2921732 RepID=UPI001F13542B|nr:NUDIX domain-containing protein [Microbacterium sp. CFH 31415]MCH6231662.1 NUDIX domain-containing protein [Microbacterium sp. CFH 31415]
MTTSAGILLYRLGPEPEVLIAHMGGPYWASKDAGAWSIPKGEFREGDEPALDAAQREFREELGIDAPGGPYAELGTFVYSSGKRVTVFIADGAALSLDGLEFGEFELEWPPRSGRTASFPEVDRVEWMPLPAAREKLVKGQRPALDALESHLAEAGV